MEFLFFWKVTNQIELRSKLRTIPTEYFKDNVSYVAFKECKIWKKFLKQKTFPIKL